MRGRWRGLVVIACAVVGLVGCRTSDVELTPTEELGAALRSTATVGTYRVTMSTAQSLSSTALGVDVTAELDPDVPTMTAEVGPDRGHVVVDVAALLGTFSGDLGPLPLEVWYEPGRMVIDTRAYDAIFDQNPSAELGPFRPGVAFVDLAAVGFESPDLVEAMVGSGIPDLTVLADALPGLLDDVTRTGEGAFHGSVDYADLVALLGGDIDQVARSAAAGVAMNMPVDVDRLAAFYADFYRRLPSDVDVELDGDRVRAITTRSDLSGLFSGVFAPDNPLDLPLADDELADGRDAFSDTRWTIESLLSFSVDDVTVEGVPVGGEDRTQEWVDFYRTANGASTAPTDTSATDQSSSDPSCRADDADPSALASLLVSTVPDGFVRQDDEVGDTGPSDLAKAARDDGEGDALGVLSDLRFRRGYQRLWAHENGDIVVVFVYEFCAADGAADYRDRTRQFLVGDIGIETFDPGLDTPSEGFRASDGRSFVTIVAARGPYLVQVVSAGTGTGAATDEHVARATTVMGDQLALL